MSKETAFSLPADGLPDKPISVMKTAEASAEAASPAYPLGERNAPFDGSAVESAFALLLTKVTKPRRRRD